MRPTVRPAASMAWRTMRSGVSDCQAWVIRAVESAFSPPAAPTSIWSTVPGLTHSTVPVQAAGSSSR